MRLTHTLKLINHHSLDALKKSLKITIDEAPQYINKIRDEKKKIVFDKLERLNKWYVRVIGLDEVKLYQDRVTSLEEQLLKTQEKRREVSQQLADIRQKSLEMQEEIHKVKRREDVQKFLDLMKEETEILQLENSVARTFQEYDQTERELFTSFTNAIRDSHEKQRAQIEYTKYFGLVLSIAGSFLAFVYTSVKKQDLKKFLEEKLTALASSGGDPVVLDFMQANKNVMKEVQKTKEALVMLTTVIANQEQSKSSQVNIKEQYQLPTNIADFQNNEDLKKIAITGSLCFISGLILAMMVSR